MSPEAAEIRSPPLVFFMDSASPGVHDLIDQVLHHLRVLALAGQLQDARVTLALVATS